MIEKIEKSFGPLDDIDRKSFRIIANVIAKNNLPGFDYLEFKEAVRAMHDMDIEEATAFRSAYAAGKTVGLTLDKLESSTDHYLKVLDSEKKNFDVALNHQIEAKILTREKEKEKLIQKISALEDKKAQIEKEIALTQERLENYDTIVEETKEKLQTASDNFHSAIRKLTDEISSDIKIINQTLR